jgi:hypothetical protein
VPSDRSAAEPVVMTDSGLVDCFRSITVVDFKYEVNDSDLPRVLCMVAYTLDQNLRHVGTVLSG